MRNRHPFWFLFYNAVVIPLIYLGMQAIRPFNAKVRQGIQEHRGLFQRLHEIKQRQKPDLRTIVIHCASAGEFEAARPVLSLLKKRVEKLHIHVTYFSPSGEKPISKAPEVDSYSYLPFDDFLSVRRFFHILKPDAFLIVKHDVWPNMVWMAAKKGIPSLWINANLHEKSRRLGLFGRGFNSSFLSQLSVIVTVGDSHSERLTRLVSPVKVLVEGDSRYDRTVDRMKQSEEESKKLLPSEWLDGKKVILGGSTWGPDQRILVPAYAALKRDFPDLYLILVPHEPNQEFLADTEYYLQGMNLRPVRYSQLDRNLPASDVLLIDKVGILATLYRSVWVAFVGGAFGDGVHSVLEPAVYGLPLFFGTRYYMSHEAQSLIQRGGAKSVTTPEKFEQHLRRYLEDEQTWKQAADESRRLVERGLGATDRIVDCVQRLLSESGKTL